MKNFEILLEVEDLSKKGQIPLFQLSEILNEEILKKRKKILNLDLLCRQSEIFNLISMVEPHIKDLDSIRFLDPGLGKAIQNKWPNMELQMIVEHGIPNVPALLTWVESYGGSLKRLVLSNQLPLDRIKVLREHTDLELELLCLGPIETFYSPRHLLQPLFAGEPGEEFKAYSEDRPHQVSNLIQNKKGTLMYHDKHLSLLDEIPRAIEAGITHFRLQAETKKEFDLLNEYWNGETFDPALKKAWPHKTTRGFFIKNRTDKPLKRLTNFHLQELRGKEVAEVIDAKKGEYVIFELKEEIELPIELKLCNPEGKEVVFTLKEAWRLSDPFSSPPIQDRIGLGVYRAPWVKAALSKSLILKYHGN